MIKYDMPAEDYFAMEGLNASLLKSGAKSMKAMKSYNDNGITTTPAMAKGTQLHTIVLEPELFGSQIALYDGRRAGKAWEQFQADNEGKEIVKPNEMTDLFAVRDSVWANEKARLAITNTSHEVALSWECATGKGKARLDGYNEQSGLVLEFKTTSDASPAGFTKQAYNMNYHIQLGWIRSGLLSLGLKCNRVVVVAAEQKAPYDVVCYEVGEDVLDRGEADAFRIERKWKIARDLDIYEGACEEGAILSLPAWANENEEWEVK